MTQPVDVAGQLLTVPVEELQKNDLIFLGGLCVRRVTGPPSLRMGYQRVPISRVLDTAPHPNSEHEYRSGTTVLVLRPTPESFDWGWHLINSHHEDIAAIGAWPDHKREHVHSQHHGEVVDHSSGAEHLAIYHGTRR